MSTDDAVSMEATKASTHYVRVLAEQAARLGFDATRLLVEAGIAPATRDAAETTIDNERLAALLRLLWQWSGDETVGILPVPTRLGSFAFVFEYFMTAETLGEMLRKAHRALCYVVVPGCDVHLREVRGEAVLEVPVLGGPGDPDHFLAEFWVALWHRVACWAIGERIPLIRAEFSHPAPEHWSLYERLFQCRVTFGAPGTTLAFNDKYLRQRICRDRQAVLAWLRHSPADLLYVPAEDHTLTTRIRTQLLAGADSGADLEFPAVEELCAELHLTPQTLRRRLLEEGTSYQQIKDDVRCRLVMQLLANPDIAIGEIAMRVGFAEPTVLTRAFRKWTGMTPEGYRQRQRAH